MDNIKQTCEHDWVHMDSKRREEYQGYHTKWMRIDLFYCRKCLEQRQTEKMEYQRERPDWY